MVLEKILGLGKFSAGLEISASQTGVSESRARKTKTGLGISHFEISISESRKPSEN